MTEFPLLKNTKKPHRLVMPEIEGVELPVVEVEMWRHGDFLVAHYPAIPGSIIVDLDGETYIKREGGIEEAFAIVDALYGIKLKGKRMLPPLEPDISDTDFIITCTENMAMLGGSGGSEPDLADDPETFQHIYRSAQDDLLNELIKPPKKDK
jgi:hypothetical protein